MINRIINEQKILSSPWLANPLRPSANPVALAGGQKIIARPIMAGTRPSIIAASAENLTKANHPDWALIPERVSYRPKPRPILKLAAAAAGGAALLLLPATALAGTGLFSATVTLFSSLGPVGWAGSAVGAYLTGKLLIGKYRELQPENYQSKNMKLNVGNPTPRKLFKTLVLPAWGFTMGIGALLAYAPLIDGGTGILTATLVAAVAAKPLLTMVFNAVRDVKQAIEFQRKGIQRHLPKHSLIAELATEFAGAPAQLATIGIISLLSKAYATQMIADGFFETLANIPATFTSLAQLAHLGEYVLAGALVVGAFRFVYGWAKAVLAKFPDELPSRLKSSLTWGAIGAGAGALVYLLTPGMAIANLLTFTVTLAFAHITIHSLLSQEGGVRQAAKKQPVFDLESLWHDVRSARGASRTVFRPSIGMVDSLISGYLMLVMTEGANWVLKGVDGTLDAPTYVRSQEMIECLLNRDGAVIRRIIKEGYANVKKATTPQEANDTLAQVFENLARLIEDPTYERTNGHPLAWGDLKTRSGGLGYLKDGTFCAAIPDGSAPMRDAQDPKAPRSDQDLRIHGEHMRYGAKIFREKARRLRAQVITTEELDSQRNVNTEKLEAAYRRANPPTDSHPRCFWTTFWTTAMPDPYNIKQSGVDEFLQIMADFVGVMDTVVMTADGRIHIWPIPMTVVKDFKPEHKDIRSIDSREELGEDLRIGWYQRSAHDIPRCMSNSRPTSESSSSR